MNKTARREYFRKIESLFNITKAFKIFYEYLFRAVLKKALFCITIRCAIPFFD
jgi:hypothetical protein